MEIPTSNPLWLVCLVEVCNHVIIEPIVRWFTAMSFQIHENSFTFSTRFRFFFSCVPSFTLFYFPPKKTVTIEIKMSCSTTMCRLNCKWIDMDTKKKLKECDSSVKCAGDWTDYFFISLSLSLSKFSLTFYLSLSLSVWALQLIQFRMRKTSIMHRKTCTSWEWPLRYNSFRSHRRISNSHQTISTTESHSMRKQNIDIQRKEKKRTHSQQQQQQQSKKKKVERRKRKKCSYEEV